VVALWTIGGAVLGSLFSVAVLEIGLRSLGVRFAGLDVLVGLGHIIATIGGGFLGYQHHKRGRNEGVD
jgi:predicted transcriptional regulator with HTH domain